MGIGEYTYRHSFLQIVMDSSAKSFGEPLSSDIPKSCSMSHRKAYSKSLNLTLSYSYLFSLFLMLLIEGLIFIKQEADLQSCASFFLYPFFVSFVLSVSAVLCGADLGYLGLSSVSSC